MKNLTIAAIGLGCICGAVLYAANRDKTRSLLAYGGSYSGNGHTAMQGMGNHSNEIGIPKLLARLPPPASSSQRHGLNEGTPPPFLGGYGDVGIES